MIPLNAKKVFSWIIFDIYQWEQEMFDWTTSTFEMAKRAWTVMVIPVLDNWKILIWKQEQPWKWQFIDFLWWRQERWEETLITAKRELFEESWYRAKEFELIISKNLWWSKLEWEINYYIARWLGKVWEQKLDSWEKIELLEVSLSDFLNLNFPKDVEIDEDFIKTIKYISWNKEVLDKLSKK